MSPIALAIRPRPLPTEKLVAAPESVYAPPSSAVPRPLATVRVNVSVAYFTGAAATVTGADVDPV